jgi:hypothetical protein
MQPTLNFLLFLNCEIFLLGYIFYFFIDWKSTFTNNFSAHLSLHRSCNPTQFRFHSGWELFDLCYFVRPYISYENNSDGGYALDKKIHG